MFGRTLGSLMGALLVAAPCVCTSQAAVVLQADFNGAGNGTGGAADIVALGGTGTFTTSAGTTTGVVSTSPFASGTGGYLQVTTTTTSSNAGSAVLNPATAANSPAALTPMVGADRVINGALDFFFRTDSNLDANAEARFFNIGAASGGLRIFLQNQISPNRLRFFVLAPANGLSTGSADGAGTTGQLVADTTGATGQLVANTVYHIGMAFDTDVNGAVTMKLWVKQGTGAIDLVNDATAAVTTFGIDETNTTGGFTTGSFSVGITSPISQTVTQEFDTFRLYNATPTVFDAVVPEPASLGLVGFGLLLMSSRFAKHS